MRSAGLVITIDGPSASGKTSVSRDLANSLGWKWVSTGAFYRGLAFVASSEHFDLQDEQSLARLANDPLWSVQMGELETSVIYRGKNVNSELSKETVGMLASRVSQYSKVRAALLASQRACHRPGEVLVAEGRDCGTVVFPQALLKFYLTASLDHRVLRRSIEEGQCFEQLKGLQQQRDQSDEGRSEAPLQVPAGGIIIDSSAMGLDEVVGRIKDLVVKELRAQKLESFLPKPLQSL